MKLLKRILLILLVIVLIVIIGGLLFIWRLRTSALPDYSEDVNINSLRDEVTVMRDSFAIPHIYAGNDRDLYLATGYTMAQDRLWQMDLLRRVTQGRLSEVMGKEQAETDLFMRSLRIQEKSEKVLEQTTPEILSALEAFSEGVNYYINNHPLPPEFTVLGYKPEPWEPVHSVNLIGYMSWDLSSGWGQEYLLHQLAAEVPAELIREFIPSSEAHSVPVFSDITLNQGLDETLLSANTELERLGAQIFYGSNNWAVSGKKSKTGLPLLANDMHLGFMSPGIWYQMHQVVEGSLNVTGLVLPGQPFVICGHNDSIAWGMTNVTVDDLDFYAETINDDTTKYLLNGKWHDFLINEEKIATKEGEVVNEKLRFTHRGPLINKFKNEKETPLSIRWMGNEMSNELRTVYLLNRAADWEDFRKAVVSFKSVSQNIVYADVMGNIGLQTAAGIPIREGTGISIYRGDTSLYDWQGFVPFEELPYEYNPDRGYVSSANNKTVPDDYPYYIGSWFAVPDRITRIRELLDETELHGTEDFVRMHDDYKSVKAERFLPFFLNAIQPGNNNMEIAAYRILRDWDYVMSGDSRAAMIFEIHYRKICENLLKDELSPELFISLMGQRILLENLMENILIAGTSEWMDNKKTPETETLNDIIQRSFEETVVELSEKLGDEVERWEWSRLHTLTISHPLGVVNILDKVLNLNRGPKGVAGSFHTITPYSYSYNNLYKVSHGASYRHIFNLSDWNASKTIIPTGTSGIPASDYYLDQFEMYLENKYHADPFTQDEVERLAKYSLKLLPQGSELLY